MENSNYIRPEAITSVDYIIGQAHRFEPKEEVFIQTSNGAYGVVPYYDHFSDHYYFVTISIDETTVKPRVILNLTREAFSDKALVRAMLAYELA